MRLVRFWQEQITDKIYSIKVLTVKAGHCLFYYLPPCFTYCHMSKCLMSKISISSSSFDRIYSPVSHFPSKRYFTFAVWRDQYLQIFSLSGLYRQQYFDLKKKLWNCLNGWAQYFLLEMFNKKIYLCTLPLLLSNHQLNLSEIMFRINKLCAEGCGWMYLFGQTLSTGELFYWIVWNYICLSELDMKVPSTRDTGVSVGWPFIYNLPLGTA